MVRCCAGIAQSETWGTWKREGRGGEGSGGAWRQDDPAHRLCARALQLDARNESVGVIACELSGLNWQFFHIQILGLDEAAQIAISLSRLYMLPAGCGLHVLVLSAEKQLSFRCTSVIWAIQLQSCFGKLHRYNRNFDNVAV